MHLFFICKGYLVNTKERMHLAILILLILTYFYIPTTPTKSRFEHVQSRAPRRTADCVGAVKLCENHSFRGHPFEVGRAGGRMAVNGQISVTQVIGEEDDDIRLASSGTGPSRSYKCNGDPHAAIRAPPPPSRTITGFHSNSVSLQL